MKTIKLVLLGLKDYFRFTLLSNNWVILSFSIVLTSFAIIDEMITQGEVFQSLLFLVPFVLVVAYTIHTFLESRK